MTTVKLRRIIGIATVLCCVSASLFAQEGTSEGENLTHLMTQLVLQLAIILFATWLGGKGAEKLGLPKVIGQIIAGIVIGPFLLGSIAIPGYPFGLFPPVQGAIPVSPLIHSISSLAAIILLFIAGLETDLKLFLRYAVKGSIVGAGGVVVSFFAGAWLTTLFIPVGLGHPSALFMGTVSVATSVGITASILSDKRKMDSPEGVVILSAAVIDDVLAIIILAVVLGVADLQVGSHQAHWGHVALVALRAVGVWLFFTAIGLIFSRQIGKFLKNSFKNPSQVSVMAFALALLMAGLFESAGLSMIIGAYIVGLSLSNTDLAFIIHSKLKTLHDFFVPVFFAVSGMMLNLQAMLSWEVLGFGLLFTVICIAAKMIGASGPSLLLNFNLLGAARIGLGMVPRGEVALIIAGIGMGAGVIGESLFGIALLMTVLSTVSAPPLLNVLLEKPKSGQIRKDQGGEKTETSFSFDSQDFALLVINTFTAEMEKEGFFVTTVEHGENIIQMRKDDIFISLYLDTNGTATFLSEARDVNLFRTALYESLLSVTKAATQLQTLVKPKDLAKSISTGTSGGNFDIMPFTSPDQVILDLKATDKASVISEMLALAHKQHAVIDENQVKSDVLAREASMTTGLAHGVAIPHAKSDGVSRMTFYIGVKREGLDFQALDGKPSNIFILILTPKQGHGPHIQLMSTVTGLLNHKEVRNSLLSAEDSLQVLEVLQAAQKLYKK